MRKWEEVNKELTCAVITRAAGTVLWRSAAWCGRGAGLSLGGANRAVSLSCRAPLSLGYTWLACRCAARGRCFRPCTWIWFLFLLSRPLRASGAVGYISSGPCSSSAVDNWYSSCCCLCFGCCSTFPWLLCILCLGCLTLSWLASCPQSIRLHGWRSTTGGRGSVFRHPLGPVHRRTLRSRWRAFHSPWLQDKEITILVMQL